MNLSLFESQILSTLVRGACFTAIVLVVGLLLIRRCSAHRLSLLWRGALLGLCLLPLLAIVSPPIPILPARAEVAAAVGTAAAPVEASQGASAEVIAPAAAVIETDSAAVASGTAVTVAKTSKRPWLAILWMTGVALMLSRWLVAMVRVRLLWRAGRSIDPAGWDVESGVRLRISEDVSLPMTWGSRRPAILLPSDAEDWDAETRRTVLAHELAHARRGDSHFLLVAQLATAMHWANPLVWIIGRRLRDAQERVADDSVLATGQDAGDYATLLLEFAKRCTQPAPLAVSAMANPSSVGKRIERVLDDRQSRGQLGAVACCLGALVILTTTTIVAAAAPQAAAEAKGGNETKAEHEQPTNDRGQANLAKLKSIIIPQLDFNEQTLEDAIAFLRAEVKQRDPDKQGIPFRILNDGKKTPPINMQLSSVPVLDALNFTAQLAKVDFIIKSTGVEVGTDVAKGRETRRFQVPRKLAAKIEAAGGAETYWSKLGATFPDGSTISGPTEKGGGMTAGHNPIANLKLMERHIGGALKSGDTPTKTWIEEKLDSIVLPQVEFDDATIEEAVDFLRRQSRTHDPDKLGLNFIIRSPGAGKDVKITLSMMNASLSNVVNLIALEAGMKVNTNVPLAVIFEANTAE